MLINTVILILRDGLPLFVLVSLLWVTLPLNKRWLIASIVLGIICSALYINLLPSLDEWFTGAAELSLWLMHLLNYLLATYLGFKYVCNTLKTKPPFIIAGTMLVLTFVTKGSSFVLYLTGAIQQTNALQSMLLGSFLGLGICLSLMVLIYFISIWLKYSFSPWLNWAAILVYTSGQLINSYSLLVQADLIDASKVAWSSQHIISNQSEYGQLLNVLFGYQASPSIHQIILSIGTLMIPLLTYFYIHKQNDKQGEHL